MSQKAPPSGPTLTLPLPITEACYIDAKGPCALDAYALLEASVYDALG